jgi:hypothetical protein
VNDQVRDTMERARQELRGAFVRPIRLCDPTLLERVKEAAEAMRLLGESWRRLAKSPIVITAAAWRLAGLFAEADARLIALKVQARRKGRPGWKH